MCIPWERLRDLSDIAVRTPQTPGLEIWAGCAAIFCAIARISSFEEELVGIDMEFEWLLPPSSPSSTIDSESVMDE
jgi:hypothetical protein